jgi:phosphotransacetylase
MAQRRHEKYEKLIARCKPLPATPTAVAHPCDESSLRGAADAAKAGLIAPILVGPRARIEALAKEKCIDVSKFEMVDAAHSHASADAAVRASLSVMSGTTTNAWRPAATSSATNDSIFGNAVRSRISVRIG